MIKIKNLKIGKNSKPVIIAEMSGNHNRSLKRALKIVDAAAAEWSSNVKTSNIYGRYNDNKF